jgi:hypothetical protein
MTISSPDSARRTASASCARASATDIVLVVRGLERAGFLAAALVMYTSMYRTGDRATRCRLSQRAKTWAAGTMVMRSRGMPMRSDCTVRSVASTSSGSVRPSA